jgi:hypothetical protein
MMGNPAESNWTHFKSYVIAKLPQLHTLDGTEITKSMRITACQALPVLEVVSLTLLFLYFFCCDGRRYLSQIELRALAAAKRIENETKMAESKHSEKQNAAPQPNGESESKPSSTLQKVHRGDVVVEEIGSDEEGEALYEGRVEEEEEVNNANEMTENTPEARIQVNMIAFRSVLLFCRSWCVLTRLHVCRTDVP